MASQPETQWSIKEGKAFWYPSRRVSEAERLEGVIEWLENTFSKAEDSGIRAFALNGAPCLKQLKARLETLNTD